jgi:hypothetical protein
MNMFGLPLNLRISTTSRAVLMRQLNVDLPFVIPAHGGNPGLFFLWRLNKTKMDAGFSRRDTSLSPEARSTSRRSEEFQPSRKRL